MTTFVLIHGAWHGGWCWEKVVPLLQKEGHTVVAPDLPGHGDDTTPISEISLQTYADRVCEVVNAQSEPVILVGHSLGGISITQAAEQCPGNIQKLVYLTAILLPNGVARMGYGSDIKGSLVSPNMVMAEDKTFVTIKDEAVKPAFYQDCSAEDVARAKSLIRPVPMAGFVTPVSYTEENFGRIPRVYIECLQDRAIPIELQRRMTRETPVEQVISMDTGHSPFFAAPEELATHILGL